MFETSSRRRLIVAAIAILLTGAWWGTQANAALVITTNMGGADGEVRESETNIAPFTTLPRGANRGLGGVGVFEMATRINDQVNPLNAANPGAVTDWFNAGDRSSVMYLKFNILSLPASNDPFWDNHQKVHLRTTVMRAGNFSGLNSPNPSSTTVPPENTRLKFRVMGLDPNGTYIEDNPLAINRTDRLGHPYLADQYRYDWLEGNDTLGTGITFYNAPGITPHCMVSTDCLDPNIPHSVANSVVQTLGIYDDFNGDAIELGTYFPPDPLIAGNALQIGQGLDFRDKDGKLRDLILDAKDAGRTSVTLMVHLAIDGTVHQPNVGRPGTSNSGQLARNYAHNTKERTTLMTDTPANPNSGASNATGKYSPQLRIFVPEPSSVILVGVGMLMLGLFRRRA